MITVLFDSKNSISLKFSLYPIFTSKFFKNFHFIDKEGLKQTKKTNTILILGKFFTKIPHNERIPLLESIKNNYKKIIFFDDLDGSEIQFFEYFNFFDLYFKKQIYADKSMYLKNFIGNKFFTDYYAVNFGIHPQKQSNYKGEFLGKIDELEKIKVSWNLGIGNYSNINGRSINHIYNLFGKNGLHYLFKALTKFKVPKEKPMLKCQARFSYNPQRGHIDFQRKLFLEITSKEDHFISGRINSKQYSQELKKVSAVLSPFGYGEICFRDFEAILNGSVLVKPDMSHINTWPNIYLPNETYVPVNWNGNDLIEKVDYIFSHPLELNRIRMEAFNTLKNSYTKKDEKVEELLDFIT